MSVKSYAEKVLAEVKQANIKLMLENTLYRLNEDIEKETAKVYANPSIEELNVILNNVEFMVRRQLAILDELSSYDYNESLKYMCYNPKPPVILGLSRKGDL